MIAEDSLDVLGSVKGLSIHLLSGVIRFDRDTPVRHLSTATLRGLAGHALRWFDPELVDRLFKPGVGGQTPPAYGFQPLHRETGMAGGFPFRLVTWDSGNELMPALRSALDEWAVGKPFGESGANVASFDWQDEQKLVFEGVTGASPVQRLVLATPLRLAVDETWLTERTLTLGHVVQAGVRRLNLLSRCYGNGIQLDGRQFMASAACVRETDRSLRLVAPGRWSSTQGQGIELAGLVGHMVFEGMTNPLVSLISIMEVMGIGKHTAEGCGMMTLRDAASQ